MEEKIKTDEIVRYSQQFSLAIAGNFFKNKEKITGQEILTFCSVRQVNLFIVYELMRNWISEGHKWKSPYFDFKAKAVQEALAQFQNTLSNNILISQADFIPLVEKAVRNTLALIISPYDFYSSILDNQGEEFIRVADLKKEVKYIKINGAPLEKLLQKLTEEKQVDILPGKEAFALLDGILEEVNFSPEEPDTYLVEFSKVIKVTLSDFYEPVPTVIQSTKKVVTVPPVKKVPGTSQPTLYDHLAPAESKPTLADNFQKKKIARLRDSLSINQKFMFTKMLFNGDFEIFSQAIERIDTLDNLKQALSYLQNDYPEWDRESEEYAEFLMMVEKRFLEEEI